ncbi:endonuclease dU [Stetteria hydrogenophila]
MSACDDGRVHKLGGGYTTAACVCYDGLDPVGVSMGILRVDGLEASGVIAHLAVSACRARPDAVLLDSVTIAGFNVVSPPALVKLTGASVIVAYTYKPAYERLAPALAHAPGPLGVRSRVLSIVDRAVRVDTPKGPLYLVTWGTTPERATALVSRLQIHARIPEPLRVAHMVASAASEALKGLLRRCG